MTQIIGIRREDKNKWEKRVPLIPEHVKDLQTKYDITTLIQPSTIRAYNDETYQKTGAIVTEDLSKASVIFAVKEIPLSFFQKNKTYVFFSHTVKGQAYNMPMLKKMMELQCTLIDYERIIDENNRRLIFFGRYAGIAGMVDTLWGFGKRLRYHHIKNPFEAIKQTYQYRSLTELKQEFTNIGKDIETEGLPEPIHPLIVGFAGYGNVSKGAQEILDLFPFVELQPDQLKTVFDDPDPHTLYKVVFKEEDMVQPKEPSNQFQLQDYYQYPDKYTSKFERYLPYLSILINAIYWDERYPRMVTKQFLRTYQDTDHKLRLHIIGDISVDINGAIEPTAKVTTPDNPVFTYDPKTDTITDGYKSPGMTIMAVDNLPCELPKDSSKAFSEILWHFVPSIAQTDYSQLFDQLTLPPEINKAVILHNGQLTPQYTYINNYL
ncbi:MAG: bifunctional lysine ketoglutarate reductase /saccharopine dehydrogenase family protein [Candidatus Thermoplasmatota archaeon]|nr:bifunctional lysine ketoglutarate reductase /saccharopine dehydrogenase family protein [Candidatus Thermoplasmatota archaeon]